MTMDQYLFLLRAELTGRISEEALEDVLRYYTEYFEDAGTERERDVMLELGSPQRLAEKILGENFRDSLVPLDADYAPADEETFEESGLPRWIWQMLAFGGAALAAMVVIPVLLGLALGGAICVVVGIGLVVGGFFLGSFAAGLLLAGGGLLTAAIGLVMILGTIAICRGAAQAVRWVRNNVFGEEYFDEETE